MTDWTSTWNVMQREFQRVEDARAEFDAVFADGAGSTRLAQAQAAVDFAKALCRFMTTCDQRGVFAAMIDTDPGQVAARKALLDDYEKCLRDERALIIRAGVKAPLADALLDEIRRMGTPPYPGLQPDIWRHHVAKAQAIACKFPGSALLLLATNLRDYVQELSKPYGVAKGAMVAGANIKVALLDPTLVSSVGISMLLGWLLGSGQRGSGSDA
jgi:hypothetical protein